MAIDKSLVSGSTSMLLLRLLEEKDMYGYEMIETLESRSNHVFLCFIHWRRRDILPPMRMR